MYCFPALPVLLGLGAKKKHDLDWLPGQDVYADILAELNAESGTEKKEGCKGTLVCVCVHFRGSHCYVDVMTQFLFSFLLVLLATAVLQTQKTKSATTSVRRARGKAAIMLGKFRKSKDLESWSSDDLAAILGDASKRPKDSPKVSKVGLIV